jgi:lysozyme family protein
MKVLNLGERSVLVQYVQLALNRAGYDIRKDGILGENTCRALQQFLRKKSGEEIRQRNEAKEEERKSNREEVLRVVEETWGHPPMISLKTLNKQSQSDPSSEDNDSKKDEQQ